MQSSSARQEPRLPVNWAVGVLTGDGPGNQVFYTMNICSTGMCLQGAPGVELLSLDHRVGTRLPVRLYLPGESPLTDIEAELKWQVDQRGQLLSGWQFASIAAESRRKLYKKIEILLPGLSAETYDLATLESIIQAKIETGFFYEVGKALDKIRTYSLHTDQYTDFLEYCRGRWTLSPSRAFLLINAASIIDNISAQGATVLPQSETLVKPLVKLLPDFQWKVWQAVLANAADGHITEDFVQEAVERFIRGQELNPGGAPRSEEIPDDEEDQFSHKLAEAKRAFMQLCKTVTDFGSIAEVRGKVDPHGDPHWWKDLNLVFRSHFAEGEEGNVEFKGFRAELELGHRGEELPGPLPCWKVLGIEPTASVGEARKARVRLVKEYHPDRIPPGVSAEFKRLATQRTREVNRAYEEFVARSSR
jgi:hypothetical protein